MLESSPQILLLAYWVYQYLFIEHKISAIFKNLSSFSHESTGHS